jgi:hypothetical protein
LSAKTCAARQDGSRILSAVELEVLESIAEGKPGMRDPTPEQVAALKIAKGLGYEPA